MYSYQSHKRKKKKDSEMKKHFFRRFEERFKRPLTLDEYNMMKSSIKKNKSDFIYSQSNSRSVHAIKLPDLDEKICVVYNKLKHEFHTCFPLSWVTKSLVLRSSINSKDG